jgi:putative transposase
MLVYEFKLKGKPEQYRRIDEAIRTGKFIRNSCLRFWMDSKKMTKLTVLLLIKIARY